MNILWDFDGTLFDTYPSYTRILKEILNNRVNEQEILAKLKVSFSHAIKHFRITEDQVQRFREQEAILSPVDTPPFPGVEQVLKFAAINVIMTHKGRKEVTATLEHYRLQNYFTEIVSKDDDFPRKPDPASYLYLHERHRIDLAIGDREIDILPAKQLGMKTCLFQNQTAGADYYLDDYSEFFQVLRMPS